MLSFFHKFFKTTTYHCNEHLYNNSMVSSAMKYCIQTFLIYNAKLFELHFVHYHRQRKKKLETLEKTCCINTQHSILFIHQDMYIYIYAYQLYINTLLSMLNIRLDIFFFSREIKRNKYSKDKRYGAWEYSVNWNVSYTYILQDRCVWNVFQLHSSYILMFNI